MTTAADIQGTISTLPAELQECAARWCERLQEAHGAVCDAAVAPTVLRLVASSEFGGNTLLRYWPEIAGEWHAFDEAFDLARLTEAATAIARSESSIDEVMSLLRRERNLCLLHILWREVAGVATVQETIEALSDVADQLLRAAAVYAQRQLMERFGVVRDASGDEVPLVILGMGKLGGRELNFSSDIDIIFSYARSGESDGRKCLHAQEYFDRMSRHIVRLIDERSADGFVFRTDTRLRPFGDSGPPVVSFAALESYLVQHGRDWERYAYVKARIVGQPPPADVSRDLFSNLIAPFVYRRYLDFGVFESLREMHAMISNEVKRLDRVDNVKLGPGGIREIEFIVQSFQLVRGGSKVDLQDPSLLDALQKLVEGRALEVAVADGLADAYLFLRRLENFIQALHDKQTHDLPVTVLDRARLAFAMGFADWPALCARLRAHRQLVTTQFENIAFRGAQRETGNAVTQQMLEAWDSDADESSWKACLRDAGFSDADLIARHLLGFRKAPAARKMDSRASERLQEFIPRLLSLAQSRKRPAVAVERCLAVIEKILRRSAYIALLNENRVAAERLVGLCERSAYIAAEIAHFPVLLDELLDPRLITGPITKAQLREELDDRLQAIDGSDSEARMEAIAQFQRSIMFRVAVADFNGSLPLMKVSDSLTFLAETVLDEALATAWQDLTAKHGVPCCDDAGASREVGFGIIAYGKLGGLELSYGSDLDIVFLHDSSGKQEVTNGEKALDNALFFSRLVRRLVHFLTTQTSSGVMYEIDTRLRPSGRKGLLVTSTEAFERYQEKNAWTWEHQALLRARAVAGSPSVGAEFERIRTETLGHRVRRDSLGKDVVDMRSRMRKELDRSDARRFDLKQGRGGIGDIEFLVQYLVLKHSDENAELIEFSDNIRQLDALVGSGILEAPVALELQDIYRQYRQRQHHLVLNEQAAVVGAAEFVDQRRRVAEAWDRYFGA
jgi:glutamate-ammonia-ligase adenylyltransferase